MGLVDKIRSSNGEGRHLEFKQSTSWEDHSFRLKLTKSILAMSNVRFGGEIIIGVKQIAKYKFDAEGMSDSDFESYNHDDVSSFVAEFADPYVQFILERIEDQGKKFVLIRVNSFDYEPIICKKDGWSENTPLLHKGLLYVRSRRMAESSPVSTVSELREILDMATEYGVSKVLRIAQNNQLITSTEMIDAKNKKSFNIQYKEYQVDNKDTLDSIYSRGYWSVLVYQSHYFKDRLQIEDCQRIVLDSIVKFREYTYPPISYDCFKPDIGADYVQWNCPIVPSDLFKDDPRSIFRIFTSGQFINHFSLMDDFWKNSKENSLNINTTIGTITEIFYFISQLANRNIFEGRIHLEIGICNIRNKELTQGPNHTPTGFKSNLEEIISIQEIEIPDVIGNWKEHSINTIRHIFQRFGMNTKNSLNILRDRQEEVINFKL